MSYSPISLYHFSSQKEKSNIDWITPSSLVMNLHIIVQTLDYSVQTRLTRIWSRYYHNPLSSTYKCCRTDRVRSVSLRVCTASVWAQIFWHFPCHIDLFMWMCQCVAQTSQRKYHHLLFIVKFLNVWGFCFIYGFQSNLDALLWMWFV